MSNKTVSVVYPKSVAHLINELVFFEFEDDANWFSDEPHLATKEIKVYHSIEDQKSDAEETQARNIALAKLTEKEKQLLGLK